MPEKMTRIEAIRRIRQRPDADAPELVLAIDALHTFPTLHCIDCKFFRKHGCPMRHFTLSDLVYHQHGWNPDGYCNFAAEVDE